MLPFTLEKARSAEEALAGAASGGRFIAGGTTLIDLMREEVERPERLIDINALPMKEVRIDGQDLVIGALATMAEVAAHPEVQRLQPIIAESLIEGASPQLRNMATMGGNLLQRVRCPYFRMLDAACNKRVPGSGCSAIDGLNSGHAIFGASNHCVATHPSDVAVALVALDATMRVRGPQGERRFAVEELFRLPGDTPHLEHTLAPGELIMELRISGGSSQRRGRYLKVRDRASYEYALVSTAAVLTVENGVIREARLAAGGVGTRPWRLRQVEAALVGRPAERQSYAEAASLAVEGAQPLQHNHYKVDLLPRSIVRTLEMIGETA